MAVVSTGDPSQAPDWYRPCGHDAASWRGRRWMTRRSTVRSQLSAMYWTGPFTSASMPAWFANLTPAGKQVDPRRPAVVLLANPRAANRCAHRACRIRRMKHPPGGPTRDHTRRSSQTRRSDSGNDPRCRNGGVGKARSQPRQVAAPLGRLATPPTATQLLLSMELGRASRAPPTGLVTPTSVFRRPTSGRLL